MCAERYGIKMKRMLKRTTSLLMVVAVMMTMIGFTTIAKAETITPATDEGWSFDTETKTLTITKDTGWMTSNPWWDDFVTANVTEINTVTFAEGVKTVGKYLFGVNGTTKTQKSYELEITTVNFPSTLTTIENDAFKGLTKLKNINFAEPGEGVELTIGTRAFQDISTDYSIVIPENTISIGSWAYQLSSSATSSNADKDIVVPASLDAWNDLTYNRNYIDGIIFQSGSETKLGYYGIRNSVNYLIMPANVTVPDAAETDITKKAHIASSVTIITTKDSTADAYAKVNGNKTVYIPEGVTVTDGGKCGDNVYWIWDETKKELQFIGTGAINNGSAVYNDLVSYEEYTPVVESIVINTGITKVNQNFMRKEIGKDQPSYTGKYKDYTTNGHRGEKLTSVTFAEGLETIGNGAFYDCNNYKTVNLPASLKTIENIAFESSTVNDGINNLNIPANSQLETIGSGAFHYSALNSTLEFPATLTSIGQNAFNVSKYGSAAVKFNGAYPMGTNSIAWAFGGASYASFSTKVYYPAYAASGYETYANYDNKEEMTIDKSLTIADGTATVKFKNYTSNAIAGKMFVAAYDSSDRFITVAAPVDVNITGATTTPVSDTKTFSINASGAKYYKAFVWDNMTNVNPVTDAIRKDV